LEVPVLEWWANDYDHVFSVLNPFFRVPGYAPETAAYGPVRMSATSAEEVVDLVLAGRQKRPNEAPEDFDEAIKTTGVQV